MIQDIFRRTEELTLAYNERLKEPTRYKIEVGGRGGGKMQKLREQAATTRVNFFKSYPYWLGIDGGTDTGVACWESKYKRFSWITTLSFWDVISFLETEEARYLKGSICIVIEEPSLNRSINASKRSGNALIMGKIGQNVGSVKRETELLIQYFERKGWPYVTVKPISSKMKNAEYFNKLTGYQGKTNQHERDSALLVFGK